jgi:HK97 family phage major capsid protein
VNTQVEDRTWAARSIFQKAEAEGRDLTDAERASVTAALDAVKAAKSAAYVDQVGRQIGVGNGESFTDGSLIGGRPGDVFVKSAEYLRIKDPSARSSRWSSGPVEVPYRQKTTLTEGDNQDLGSGTPGPGAPLVPLDQQPGIQPILFQPLTIADLFAQGVTSSNAFRYVVEDTASNAAEVVPEGGAKPEQSLSFSTVTEEVKKIAAFLPVTDEMLEDAPMMRSYINQRLVLFVRNQEEEQILNGEGNNYNFLGLLPRVPADHKFVASDADTPNAADHIYAALTLCRVDSFLEPDGIIIHPDDWAELRLLKDEDKNYIGGSPFSNTGSEPGETLWNKRVVVTQAITPGRALVGAFQTAAQIYRKGGLVVEATNSHDDWFTQNLTAIRAETRLGLAIFRPSAFALADVGGAS